MTDLTIPTRVDRPLLVHGDCLVALKPFWRYYGGKYRAAPRYPAPTHGTIVEPFAGAAGYSLRYPDRNVILVDVYPVIAEIWRYLIGVDAAEIRRIPYVEHVDELPAWVPEGGRYLVGFCMSDATTSPRKSLSAGRKKLTAMGCKFEGWSEHRRERVASQVDSLRHWRVIEGPYRVAPDVRATWFIDPPYNNAAGKHYKHGPSGIDYAALGEWCRERQGQVIVCENEGANWLPFKTFATIKAGPARRVSHEVIWTTGSPEYAAEANTHAPAGAQLSLM